MFWCAFISTTLLMTSAVAQLSGSASAVAQVRFPVEKYKLDNGLTVLLQPDNSVPTIAFHTWFRVGSKDESVGQTGIAHLFEHMMFKGTKRYDNRQYDLLLQSNGAVNNAFTSHDYTGYYVNLPSSKLELVMDMESDRMVNLQLDQASLDSEREVVKEERRMRVDNDPMGVLSEGIFSTVFKVHSYRWPVIGYMKDLTNLKIEQAQQFYKTYYAPNNAILVLAGDFDVSRAKRLIKQYYGSLASQPIERKTIAPEPQQRGQRELNLQRPFQNVVWSVSYPIPQAGHDDSYVLDLISNALGRGSSSRLHKRLVYETQLASRVSAGAYNLQDKGLFEIIVALKPGVEMQKVQDVVFNQIWRLRNQTLEDRELAKAKNQAMKDFVDGLKTSQGRAQALAYNEVLFGDYERLFQDLQKYEGITKERVLEVAGKYLDAQGRNIVRLQAPAPAEPVASATGASASGAPAAAAAGSGANVPASNSTKKEQ